MKTSYCNVIDAVSKVFRIEVDQLFIKFKTEGRTVVKTTGAPCLEIDVQHSATKRLVSVDYYSELFHAEAYAATSIPELARIWITPQREMFPCSAMHCTKMIAEMREIEQIARNAARVFCVLFGPQSSKTEEVRREGTD